jgi:hypothetical protein
VKELDWDAQLALRTKQRNPATVRNAGADPMREVLPRGAWPRTRRSHQDEHVKSSAGPHSGDRIASDQLCGSTKHILCLLSAKTIWLSY